MTDDEAPLARLLARLPQADADPARAMRVQARCRRILARRVKPAATPPPRRVESVCIVGLGVAYLISVIQYAMQ
jgi:hypothetical protein